MEIMTTEDQLTWVKAAHKSDFPTDGGAAVLHAQDQIAVFNFSSRNEWYAVQNMCPHKQQMILARGMIGDAKGEPKVACPFHKKQFSLKSGECLDDDTCGTLKTYPVKVDDEGNVFIGVE